MNAIFGLSLQLAIGDDLVAVLAVGFLWYVCYLIIMSNCMCKLLIFPDWHGSIYSGSSDRSTSEGLLCWRRKCSSYVLILDDADCYRTLMFLISNA